jgi:multiple sugar transport system permease protein
VLPDFLWNKDLLSRKYLAAQYRLIPTWQVASAYGTREWTDFAQAKDFWNRHLAKFREVPPKQFDARVRDLQEFAGGADLRFVLPALRFQPGTTFEDRFVGNWLARRDGVPLKTYKFFEPQRADFSRRDWTPPSGKAWGRWTDWLAQLPGSDRFIASSNALWQRFLASKYENNLAALNAAHGASYAGFNNGPVFTTTPPASGTLDGSKPSNGPVPVTAATLRADWETFASTRYPLYWQELRPETVAAESAAWTAWLAGDPGIADAAAWTKITGLPPEQGYTSIPAVMPVEETAARWWCTFVNARVPVSGRILLSSDENFSAFLQKKYGDLGGLNAAWGQSFPSWQAVRFPVPEADFATLTTYSRDIKWELATRNFRVVLNSLLLEGRAFYNTFVIVLLSVVTSLTINPLAAYALSRFRMRGTNKILIFLLATMALPGEVALVPGFLLVRDLHLTDTLWALVLPSAANAFSIFLLKGFFDSLPQELYEAALIDGAGEFTLFTRITIPLSMPIIAVTLLGTVTHAYNLFMPAVMYLGDVNKWPIATKIYEINQISSAGVGMAALVVSSIFPLLVFVFCQRIIMRGIILPSMK